MAKFFIMILFSAQCNKTKLKTKFVFVTVNRKRMSERMNKLYFTRVVEKRESREECEVNIMGSWPTVAQHS